jgi:hypothetical protein
MEFDVRGGQCEGGLHELLRVWSWPPILGRRGGLGIEGV